MTVKSTSVYLAFIATATLACGAMWEGIHRLLVVPGADAPPMSIVDNPRAAILYVVMGVLFGTIMWAVSTTPKLPRVQPGVWRKYRFLMWLGGLTVGFSLLFNGVRLPSLESFGAAAFMALFFTGSGWALLSQRADQARTIDKSKIRLALGQRLARAIGNATLKVQDDATTMYLTPLMRLAQRAEDTKGYWSDYCVGLARGTFAATTHLLGGLELSGQPANPVVELAMNAARVLFNERDFDAKEAEAAIAALEAL